MFVVNGTCMLGGKVFHRIDDVSEGRTGLDFLNNPGALVPKKELAERIVDLLNEDRRKEKT